MAAEKLYKPTKFEIYPQKSNGISFWAFLLSILVYISIFYIFNLSPSSLVNTTKFWFFISNTLILIIAVDFGAFSSSTRKQYDQLYEDYVTKTQEKSRLLPSFESNYRQIVKTRGNITPQNLENQEKIKDIVVVHHHHHRESESTPKINNMQIVLKDEFKKPSEKIQEKKVELSSKSFNEVHNYEEKQVDLRRTQSEKYEPKHEEVFVEEEEEEEENEFSAMTNEELNRRVEEFINRFNRQIRLQAVQRRTRKI